MTQAYQYIDTYDALLNYCNQAKQQPVIAVDTEFVRTRTFYPHIGLVQIFDGIDAVLIDPIAIDDLSPLKGLLTDPNVIKVLHACSEDLETFEYAMGIMPEPLFDSQVAAQLAGLGNSLGYGRLVELLQGVILEKGESRTDWISRPLSPKQLQYAAEDVIYLLPCYYKLVEQLTEKGQLQWVYDEISQLIRRKRANIAPEHAYLLLKNTWKLQPLNLYALQLLAAWRLTFARDNDITQNFIIREQSAFEIAYRLPGHKSGLFALDVVTPQEARRHCDIILDLVKTARAAPESDYPAPTHRLADIPLYKKHVAQIKAICVAAAESVNVDPTYFASKRQINQIISWYCLAFDDTRALGMEPDLLVGWRGELVGAKIKVAASNFSR
ncbi:MAG: ribonuclease D [Glaciecola sp.]|nr:ribonuclease D [Glaciecola sp.]MDG1815114.1 ribonuclease D [Glaciecola sp.]